MTDRNAWTDHQSGARFSAPEDCARAASRLETRVYWRNLVEYAAGGLVALLSGGATIASLAAGLVDFAIAFSLLLGGIVMVLRHLIRRGSNLARHPEESCIAHHRAALTRQRDLLRAVPRWYLAPMLPGVIALYGVVALRVAPVAQAADMARQLGLPLLGTLAVFAAIGWLNLRAAAGLDRQLAALDRAAA